MSDSSVDAGYSPPRRALAVLLGLNLLGVTAVWYLVLIGVGRNWMALGYDAVTIMAASVTIGQYLVLALWSSLTEPRPPLRWLGHLAVCGLGAAAVAAAYFPAGWQFVGGRFGMTWGALLWEAYVTFMLVLCAGIALVLAADILVWPLRRILGCRLAYDKQPVSPTAARGFGLREMFWWVGIAAAGCWMLRAVLENVLAEDVSVVLFVTISALPVVVPSCMAALAEVKRWRAFLACLGWVAIYSFLLAAVLWMVSSLYRSPQNAIAAYILFFPPEIVAIGTIAAALTAYANAFALRLIGVRLVWNASARSSLAPELRSASS